MDCECRLMVLTLKQKLEILADAAKYDASCASGTAGKRTPKQGSEELGSLTGGTGICHSFTPDGRCVALLKILMTNYCIYDCQYCINRISSNVNRARFRVDEVVSLTMNFYKRNYIEGLFLSSGIIQSPDYTMEAMIRIAKTLREEHGFRGYIHLKTIPNATEALQAEAGLYADRLSINVELPNETSLKTYAPDKKLPLIQGAMHHLNEKIQEFKPPAKKKTLLTNHPVKRPPRFAPGGQSTQMIVGADTTTDQGILTTSVSLYGRYKLRRVYYSAFSPIPDSTKLLPAQPAPLLREHRLYQADWLLRFYGFQLDEILSGAQDGMLSLQHAPKLAWALKHRDLFPVDLNEASREMLLRVPGLGVKTADKILRIRRYHRLVWEDVLKLKLAKDTVKYFVQVHNYRPSPQVLESDALSEVFATPQQLSLFSPFSLMDAVGNTATKDTTLPKPLGTTLAS